jgi:homoserine O-acetyltransferase
MFLLVINLVTPKISNLIEGDYLVKNFTLKSGENLEELKLHYTTIGFPTKDKNGQVNNAVLIMHGTTGTGAAF